MFLSPDGSTLSLQKAIIQMKNHSELYDQTDIENIRSIVKGLRKDDGLWKPDPSVPEGWLYKKVPHQKYFREYFKQPNGEQLTGRINTIQTLMKQGYDISGKDIETLKSGLHIAGRVGGSETFKQLVPSLCLLPFSVTVLFLQSQNHASMYNDFPKGMQFKHPGDKDRV